MKAKENSKGFVYIVTNIKTNKVVYIGITTKTLESRKKDHIKKSKSKTKCYAFQQAIATLGVNAFKWESNNALLSIDELAQKEKELIAEYKSKGYNLLNKDSGGSVRKTVYKYKIEDGSLVGKYDCLENAAKSVITKKQNISKACLSSTNKHKGFLWSYKYQEPFDISKDFRKKQVVQLSLNSGKQISVFDSVAEASRETKVNKSSIAKCCRNERKSAGGFKWLYRKKTEEFKEYNQT